jgi:hypothetical protein
MKPAVLMMSALLLSTAASAAEPKTNFVDHSSGLLIEAAAAKAVMGETIPAKVWKVYPASKWAFVSQVEGGMKGTTCVVSARVMLLPLTPTVKAVLFRPQKTATAYDAAANSSTEACKAMAKDKLKEATVAVVSALVKT